MQSEISVIEESDNIPVFIIRPERLDVELVWRHLRASSEIIVLTFFLDAIKLSGNQ